MNKYGIASRTYELLLNTFKRFPQIKEVWLFGSRAKGNYKTGSDIDLAIKGENINPAIVFKLKCMFNEQLSVPYGVDVVGYDYLRHPGLKEHISRIGKRIYKQ
jgi:predicted nucleotidyltransferase